MSSRTFVAELRPDPLLRRLLAVSAMLAYLLGVVTIFSLPLNARLGAVSGVLWSLLAATQWLLISSAHKRFRRLRLHYNGAAELLDERGEWQAATVCKECIVLSTVAWLKVKPAKGSAYCELLRGHSRRNEQWRRLQVIWRHLGTIA